MDAGLRSVVAVGDPRSTEQLTRGFHALEEGNWRWTEGRFAVTLRPPLNPERGAYLFAKISVPESVIQGVGPVRLAANCNGTAVDGETYTKPGEYTYRREIPAAALQKDEVLVAFALDKFLAAGQVEGRELGLIVSVIGLESR
jgi:hypothetical protein